jgi:hypothetical protein
MPSLQICARRGFGATFRQASRSAGRRVGARLPTGLRVVWPPVIGPTCERLSVRMFIHRRPRCELPHLPRRELSRAGAGLRDARSVAASPSVVRVSADRSSRFFPQRVAMPDGRHRGRGSDWFTSGRRVLRVFGPAGSLSVGSGAGWRAGKGQLGLEDLLVCLGDVIHLVEPDVALGPVRLIAVRLDPGDQVLVDHRVAEAVRDAEEFEGVALEGAGVVIWVKGGRPPAGWMWLAAMVARSASRVAKLCRARRRGWLWWRLWPGPLASAGRGRRDT